MTASTALPVIIRRRSPGDIAARAHQALHAAIAIDWPQDRAAWRHVALAAIAVDRELDEYRALADGTAHWEQAYPELVDAEECALVAALLLMTIAAHCGKEIADGIKAAAGESQ